MVIIKYTPGSQSMQLIMYQPAFYGHFSEPCNCHSTRKCEETNGVVKCVCKEAADMLTANGNRCVRKYGVKVSPGKINPGEKRKLI